MEVSAKHVKGEKDGFGWVAQREDFKLFGERTNDIEAFKTCLDSTTSGALNLPFVEQWQNKFGDFDTKTRAFMAHGRTSTNNKALMNVHPIIKNDWALIHNGVVSNHGPDYEMTTNNDTEHVLHHLQSGGLESVARNLTGYYAFGGFSPNGDLHIARDRIAPLFCVHVPEIDSYIYGTTKELLKEICIDMFWYVKSSTAKLLDDVYVKHAASGEITYAHFTSRGKDAYSSSKASQSLGRTFANEETEAGKKHMYWTPETGMNRAASILNERQQQIIKENTKALAAKNAAISLVSGTTPQAGEIISATTKPKMFGASLSKTDRKKAIKQLINGCAIEREKWSMQKFFAFIKDSRSRYWVFTTKGVRIDREEFLLKHPEYQLQYEVINEGGIALDPFFWIEPGSIIKTARKQRTEDETRQEQIERFEQTVIEELRAIGGQESVIASCAAQ